MQLVSARQDRDPGLPTRRPASRLLPALLLHLKHEDLQMIVLYSKEFLLLEELYCILPINISHQFLKQSNYLCYDKDDKPK